MVKKEILDLIDFFPNIKFDDTFIIIIPTVLKMELLKKCLEHRLRKLYAILK